MPLFTKRVIVTKPHCNLRDPCSVLSILFSIQNISSNIFMQWEKWNLPPAVQWTCISPALLPLRGAQSKQVQVKEDNLGWTKGKKALIFIWVKGNNSHHKLLSEFLCLTHFFVTIVVLQFKRWTKKSIIHPAQVRNTVTLEYCIDRIHRSLHKHTGRRKT